MTMTMQTEEVVSTSPLSAEEYEKYGGQWIAVRDGDVIAHADSFEALAENEEVRSTDVLFRVPEAGAYFF